MLTSFFAYHNNGSNVRERVSPAAAASAGQVTLPLLGVGRAWWITAIPLLEKLLDALQQKG